MPKTRYTYDPHLPPVLRFDDKGQADDLPELLATARQRALTADEARLLAEALRNRQPWLEWAGKREKRWFDVDPVALHIHERVSAHAILKMVQREPLQRNLFADPELDYRQAIQFYQHDFRSNFQSQVGQRDVSDKEQDLTREPEQVKAYRDTWMLGIHSYLAYLRDRLVITRDLLADTGSVFVQISDENLHRVRVIMDKVFGAANFVCQISIQKTGSAVGSFIQTNSVPEKLGSAGILSAGRETASEADC